MTRILSGRVDAAPVFWNAEGVVLRERGLRTREFRVDDYGAPPYPEVVIVAREDAVRTKRDELQRAVRAIASGIQEVRAQPQRAAQRVADAAEAEDVGLVRDQLDAVKPLYGVALDRGVLGAGPPSTRASASSTTRPTWTRPSTSTSGRIRRPRRLKGHETPDRPARRRPVRPRRLWWRRREAGLVLVLVLVGGGATSLKLTAEEPGDEQFAFNPKDLDAKAGKVTITMDNPTSDKAPHAIAIDGGASGEIAQPGSKSTVTADLKPGTYTFYCPVGDHREEGMEGTLTVE